MKLTALPANRTKQRHPINRKALMLSCATLAIATAALAPQKARAQAFNGTPTTASGSVAYDGRITPNVETITINSNNATIDWAPDNSGTGNIIFLPSTNTATFQGGASAGNYTVLNRVVPTDPNRPIELNGSIYSYLDGGTKGGNVWFYSPGGIVVGSSAVFDVGGLLLSTNPVTFSSDANGFNANFTAGSSTSKIQVNSGAQISALQQNSYVALVAPRIEQAGTVKVDGSAAYVAATALTMTMNQGLFDIAVDVVSGGTDDANGVVHSGSTTGGDANSQSTNHKIYMVAVPKNQALTMLLGGTVGFDAGAGFAGYDNGEIVLSAGWTVDDVGAGERTTASTVDASIDMGPGHYLSNVFAIARGDITAIADTGSMDFAGNLNLNTYSSAATGDVTLGAENGNRLDVDGSVQMLSANPAFISSAKVYAWSGGTVDIDGNLSMNSYEAPGLGGQAMLDAYGGSIDIGGAVSMDVAGIDNPGFPQGSGTWGGDIDILANDDGVNHGSIVITGGVNLSANAEGHDNLGGEDFNSADATGGNITLYADNGGEITIWQDVFATATATGGDMQQTSMGSGGWAEGGELHIGVGDGTVHIAGTVSVNVDGIGGNGTADITGGSAHGGSATIYSGGPGAIDVDGAINMSANATGGNGQSGGAAFGGSAGVGAMDGTVTVADVGASAKATGGSATMGFGGSGGNAQGGTAWIEADANVGEGGPSFGTIVGNNANLDVSATGGIGGAGNGATILAGTGGTGVGGYYNGEVGSGGAFALAQADGASLTLANVTLVADGTGGSGGTGGTGQSGGTGGDGYGGLAQAGGFDPTQLGATAGTAVFGNLNLRANALGGGGGSGAAGQGAGGYAEGGGAVVNAKGSVDAVNATLAAGATGGTGANGGDALGGDAIIEAYAGSTATFTGDVSLNASATGGNGTTGDGGDGQGGDAEAMATNAGSQLTVQGTITARAEGRGGNGSSTGIGGDGTGGTAGIHAGLENEATVSGTASFANANIYANGFGGTGGTGGDGIGGEAHAGTKGGSFTLTGTLDGEVDGYGGQGQTASGDGYGGEFVIAANQLDDTNAAVAYLNNVDVTAIGWGADGAAGVAGGTGYGGDITVVAGTSNASLTVDTLWVNAKGQGGNGGSGATGGNGGNGFGGGVTVTDNGSMTGTDWQIYQRGVGGDGGTGSSGAGGNGGSGSGGAHVMTVAGGASADLGTYLSSANGVGGSGGTGTTTSGNGGNGDGGSNQVTIDGTVTADGSLTSEITSGFVVTAFAQGGDGATGGNATGGNSTITVNGSLTSGGIVQASGSAIAGNGSNYGGTAHGGNASLIVNGNLDSAAVFVATNAIGGNGALGGGDAYGGQSSFSVNGGSADVSTWATVSATATGGSSANAGGDGYGGESSFTVYGGNSSIGDLSVNADAFGGNASAGLGGNAHAGFALIENNGIWGSAGEVFVSADGEGGDGTNGGGTGTGGDAALRVFGAGSADLDGSVTVRAAGTGGDSSGGTGGDGIGGYARMSAYQGGTVAANNLTIDSSGLGGSGVDGGDGIAQASVEGWGGSVLQSFDAGSSVTLTGQTIVRSTGTGGAATGAGGIGGNGTGGYASLAAIGTPVSAGAVLVEANGTGGTGNGGPGSSTGGLATFRAHDNGSLTAGAVVLQANGDDGQVELLALGGALSASSMTILANGPTSGGTVRINSAGGSAGEAGNLVLGTLSATANGGTYAGDILVDVASGSSANLGAAQLTANGASPGTDEDGIEIGSEGSFTASQLQMTTSDGIRISTANGGTINVSGAMEADSLSLIRMLNDGAGSAITSTTLDLAGADIQITAVVQAVDAIMTLPGDYTINGLPVASNGLTIDAGGNITAAANLSYANSLELIAGADIGLADLSAGGDLTLIAGGDITAGDLQATKDVRLATPGGITTGNVDAGESFLALAHGDMAFGDVTASEVFLADFSMLTPSGGVTGNCVGTCGTLGADGDVTAPPTGSTYQFVTTDAGVPGEGRLPGVADGSSANGSTYTTMAFSADAGEDLSFWFNYVTSDGSSFNDYAWAQLLNGNLDPVAMLYTARTQPSGTIVPGQGLPGVEATLTPASVPIIPGAPEWSPLGSDSGSCFAAGCGLTGWINSTYEVADAGTYVLRFGVTNFSDAGYQSGMAFSGISVGGQVVTPGVTPTGGSISIGNVNTGSMTAAAGTTLTTGTLNVVDSIDLRSGGDMQTGNIAAGQSLQADSGGTMNLGALGIGQDVNLEATGNISLVSANVGTEFDFDTAGNLNGGNITAGNQISGSAGGTIALGDLTVTGSLAPGESFSVGMSAIGSITVGDVQGSDRVGFATQGDLTTGSVQAGGDFMGLVAGNITTGAITTATDGQVYLADDSMFVSGGGSWGGEGDFDPTVVLAASPVATGGSITINGPVNTGTFHAAAGTDLVMGDLSSGTVHATAGNDLSVNDVDADVSATFTADNMANFYGTVVAPTITVTSGDINIADGGQLGVWGVTDTIALNAVTGGTVYIGGTAEGSSSPGDYTFSEAGDMTATNVVFTAVGDGESAAPNVVVGESDIDGSAGADPGVSHVTINTQGSVLVNGIVDFTDAGATDSLTINAGQAIEVNTDTGGISMTDGSGAYAGTLNLTAHDIWVADSSVLGQLEANPNFPGLAAALATNNGPVVSDGYIRAGGVNVDMLGSSLLVQNSGTANDLAGITVGDGGLSITNSGTAPATVIASGHQVTSSGTVVGGDAFANDVEYSGAGGYTSNSTMNGCAVGVVCGQVTPPPPPPPPVDPPPPPPPPVEPPPPPPPPSPDIPTELGGAEGILGPIDLMNSPSDLASQDQQSDEQGEDEDSDSDSEDTANVDASLGLINTGPVNLDQPVDDPVTSGGDPGGAN